MSFCPSCGDEWPKEWPRCFACGYDGPRPGGGGGRGEVDSRTRSDGELELDVSPSHRLAAGASGPRPGQRTPSSVDSPAARRAAARVREAARAEARKERVARHLRSGLALAVLLALLGGGIAYWSEIRSFWGRTFGGEAEQKRSLGADWGGFACDPGGTTDRMFCSGWVKNRGKTPIQTFRVDVTFGDESAGEDRVKQTIEVGPIAPGEQREFREGWPVPKDQASRHRFSNVRVER